MPIIHKALRRKERVVARREVSRPASVASNSDQSRERLISELELELTRLKLREQELHEAQEQIEKNSDYYSGLFNSAPVGYMVLDSLGAIREINQAGAALLQMSRKDMIRESFTRFVCKESLSNFLKHLRQCKGSHKQVITQLWIHTHGDRRVPVELVTTSVAKPGKAVAFHTAIIDITDRQQAEEALRQSQSNYEHLVNSVEGIVWEGDASTGEFTFVSEQAERILGYPIQRWLYEPDFWASRIHPDDRERVLNHRLQAIEKKLNYFVQEFRMVSAHRRTIWLRNSVNVTLDTKGHIKLQGVMVNITELKEAEEALREETRALETLNRIGTSLTAELDINKLVEVVTEAGREVTGAKFGAFSYKHANGNGEHFMLHTTAGAPREMIARLPMPHHDPHLPPAETEKEIIRIDDLQHDPRSPRSKSRRATQRTASAIRSYLAVPVISRSGEVLGGLLFGHPSPGIFTERAQHLLAGIAAEAGIALDNARLYHAVKQSEAHFRQLADAMPQIVWMADGAGHVTYFNKRWEEFTGMPEPLRVNGEDWTPFLHPEDRSRCTEKWQEAIRSEQTFQVECRLKEHRSGNYRWHLFRANPIRDDHGHVVRWFGTSTDIEDQKQAEEKVRVLNTALEHRVSERTAQLQASNRELEAFSYSVSHDLRAPLRSINAFSELVREDYGDKLDEQGRQYLGIVRDASEQMSRLIDDLLHLSRVTRGDMRRQRIDLSAMARTLLANLRQMDPKRNVEVVIAPNLIVDGDERLLRIALENLLNNAWKFTGKQPHGRIEVGVTHPEGKPATYFVRDNGAGFDMAFANRLFSAFQRLHSSSDFPGHGVGLATVQRIITRHGGHIWAESIIDQGATFFFTLPSPPESANK
ncbi:MAG: multi-sensor signal transduction histidine kinase [Pedosphaera sp.]|nr:multi-sensor signal transduction histidine kinase [Pedosphaera sp.]